MTPLNQPRTALCIKQMDFFSIDIQSKGLQRFQRHASGELNRQGFPLVGQETVVLVDSSNMGYCADYHRGIPAAGRPSPRLCTKLNNPAVHMSLLYALSPF